MIPMYKLILYSSASFNTSTSVYLFGSSFQHYRRLQDIERKQCQDMQLYKESSTESQKVSPEPEIFRTTKIMRSDKVLLPNHNLKAQLKTP